MRKVSQLHILYNDHYQIIMLGNKKKNSNKQVKFT